jgi:DNA primase catalytic subunit
MENATSLAKYYRNDLYPFELIYRMMSCDKKEQTAEARIIGVQFRADSGVYVMHDFRRDSCQSLKQKVLLSSSRLPESLHMAHFKEGKKLVRATKELVFDLDATDFTRYCSCQGLKRLCPACWFQMQGASLILEHLLENSLGYERRHCLWVFSGCKGLHCFVNEPSVMNLSDKERKQLYKRLFIASGDDTRLIAFITSLSKTDPSFLVRLEKFFVEEVLSKVDLFHLPPVEGEGDDTFELACLRHLRTRHNALYHLVKSKWDEISLAALHTAKKARTGTATQEKENLSLRKWKELQSLEELASKKTSYSPRIFIIVRLMYPVIDPAPFNLSHQIKLPFSIHSITHNVALPLTQEDIMRMDIQRDTLSIDDVLHTKNKPPPPFTRALQLLETWIATYNN